MPWKEQYLRHLCLNKILVWPLCLDVDEALMPWKEHYLRPSCRKKKIGGALVPRCRKGSCALKIILIKDLEPEQNFDEALLPLKEYYLRPSCLNKTLVGPSCLDLDEAFVPLE